jgi:thiamine-monophosphate kinase
MPTAEATEFDLIARIRARVRDTDPSLLVGIGDDAAVFMPTPGLALVTTTDSLIRGRHFDDDWPAADLGHLALAVNLSDLAAMGASPRWALLSLTLPRADAVWLDDFLDGFMRLAEASGTSLIGGNLAAGPLNLGVQLIGEVEPSGFARRGRAQLGDRLLVTGTLGDAAAALSLGGRADTSLRQRLRRPQPRLAAGRILAARVTSMVDVSDGLLADLGHLLPKGLGAELDLALLPASAALCAACDRPEVRWPLQLAGGNDYELLVTARPDHVAALVDALGKLNLALTEIGRIVDHGHIECRRPDGSRLESVRAGWDHFED